MPGGPYSSAGMPAFAQRPQRRHVRHVGQRPGPVGGLAGPRRDRRPGRRRGRGHGRRRGPEARDGPRGPAGRRRCCGRRGGGGGGGAVAGGLAVDALGLAPRGQGCQRVAGRPGGPVQRPGDGDRGVRGGGAGRKVRGDLPPELALAEPAGRGDARRWRAGRCGGFGGHLGPPGAGIRPGNSCAFPDAFPVPFSGQDDASSATGALQRIQASGTRRIRVFLRPEFAAFPGTGLGFRRRNAPPPRIPLPA